MKVEFEYKDIIFEIKNTEWTDEVLISMRDKSKPIEGTSCQLKNIEASASQLCKALGMFLPKLERRE